MNYPSVEFDSVLAAICHGTATDKEISQMHETLKNNPPAQDAYLEQIDLHGQLATMGSLPLSIQNGLLGKRNVPPKTGLFLSSFPASMTISPWRWVAVGVVLLVLLGGTVRLVSIFNRPTLPLTTSNESSVNNSIESKETKSQGTTPKGERGSLAGIYKTTMQYAYAAKAPIIVATGRKEPLKLGAQVPYSQSGHTLHIWDWSQSPVSRVMENVRLFPEDIFAVSPDGKQLVWANGTILDLESGTKSKIDLGGAFYFGNAGGQFTRIQNLEFTLDGKHLVIQLLDLTLSPSTHPLRKKDFDTVATTQVVEFPSGKWVCDFPSGLSQVFSQDTSRSFSSIPQREMNQQIVERNIASGKLIHTLEPRLKGFAYSLSLSPEDKLLACYDNEGELLIWDVGTGQLTQKIPFKKNSSSKLKFSPDGKWLAANGIQDLFIVDVKKGSLVATIPQSVGSVMFYWSADSKTISSVLVPHLYENNDQESPFNVLPSVQTFQVEDYLKK